MLYIQEILISMELINFKPIENDTTVQKKIIKMSG